MCRALEFAAGGQWATVGAVVGACIAVGWCLSSVVHMIRSEESDR